MSDDEILRVFIITDNHLGYMEKDPVRSDDSFAAFEEVNAHDRNASFSYNDTYFSFHWCFYPVGSCKG